ncbi:thioredoxin domain-containing protein [Arthrobacter sp. NicSoilB8]|uniref:thioredoxin domain-containing protein n=1 Tax=Arthrobacter sp. NicSoilB8 TaxID=2830998 RepID=UPI001CC4F8EB|nr:thioredoxin domain-containing protein [Arthrobacter sp. NicSoilB8]BCW70146.1 thioredoxin domain-containing protein [Arthrobacter sp. NicSoilB8]
MRDPEPADGGSPDPLAGASNALAAEPSAYLRQHAGNPVHWQPFGDPAFAAAADRDVPVFLSIGYAACHWCHVMAHESFEDPDTANYLNAHFVSIKVDREERPDVDAVYMAATQAISGEGGWPMSVFLLPDGRAFHAGTYFPPRPMPGRPSFRQVLEAVSEAWTERRGAVEANAATLARGIAASQPAAAVRLDGPPEPLDAGLLGEAVAALARSEDQTHGGFGSAPKFPPSAVLEFLIRHAAVPSAAAAPGTTASDAGHPDTAAAARDMAGRTLAAMSRSALFDQLDGGFARYSVTRDWSVPHFEKMLYDNAQLLRVYAHWFRLGGTAEYPAAEAAEVAGRTADWLLGRLGLPPETAPGSAPSADPDPASGTAPDRVAVALASSLDADTVVDGVHAEGATYLWTPAGLEALLGPADGAAVAALMNIHTPGTVTADGSPLHPGRAITGREAELWRRVRPLLADARSGRPQPGRDDKVVAGWNGLAVAALADAGAALARPELVDAAERIAAYLERVHWRPAEGGPGRLIRVSHGGSARGIGGLLEDYALCAEGLFALYGATGHTRWYDLAEAMLDAACERFAADGGLQDAAGESTQVTAAQGGRDGLDPFDNATPSGAAALAGALVTHAALSGSSEHRALAANILALLPPLASRVPRVAGWLLATAQAALAGPVEAAVAGPDTPERAALHRELLLSASPGLVVAVQDNDAVRPVPLLLGRGAGPAGSPQVFLCRGMVCDSPTDSVEGVRERLARMG